MKKFLSSEREVKSYSPQDSQISRADFSLVINFPHKIFVPSKPATLQLSKMVWHLKIGQKLRVLGAKTWGVMFFQNFWLKLKGAILGPQNHFWWFQRQNGVFPNGYFGFWKKNWNPSWPFYAYQIPAHLIKLYFIQQKTVFYLIKSRHSLIIERVHIKPDFFSKSQ